MIDKKTIEHMARLSKLKLSEEQLSEYSEQIARTLSYFEQISQIPTEQVEPLVTPVEIEFTAREDVVVKELTSEEIVANAPLKSGHLFKVPPVV